MPDRRIPAPDGALDALAREVAQARALLEAETALEEAIRKAAPADRLWLLVRAQEAAAEEAASAAALRARWFGGSGSLETHLKGRPASEASAYRALAVEGARLRRDIRRVAGRTEYLAGRTVEWTQAQLDAMVQWISRTRAATYSSPYAPGPPQHAASFMDKSA